jgi:membrane fusion protein, multidrug efflux system
MTRPEMIMSEPAADATPVPARQPKVRRPWLWSSSAALAVGAGVGGILYSSAPGRSQDAAPTPPPAPSVSVAVVEPRHAVVWDEFSGRLEAVERVAIRSRVAGTVQEIHFREGALVEKGALLVTIDPAPYAAEVDRLEAQVSSAEARAEFTRTEVARGQTLLGTSALSARDVDQRVNAHKEAQAAVRAAKAALQTARLNLGYTEVRAPVAGRVGRLEVTVGNLVAAGPESPVLTQLVSVDPIYASFNANETIVARALAALSPEANVAADVGGIAVEIATNAANAAWSQGRLQLIDNQVDPTSGTVRLRAVFSNPDGRLIPGQFVRVRMAQPSKEPVIAVDERAIGTDQSKRFVVVIDGANKAAWREITLGAMAGNLRIVTSGLENGERIVVSGLQRVRPGVVVSPQPTSMERLTAVDPRSAGAGEPSRQ